MKQLAYGLYDEVQLRRLFSNTEIEGNKNKQKISKALFMINKGG